MRRVFERSDGGIDAFNGTGGKSMNLRLTVVETPGAQQTSDRESSWSGNLGKRNMFEFIDTGTEAM